MISFEVGALLFAFSKSTIIFMFLTKMIPIEKINCQLKTVKNNLKIIKYLRLPVHVSYVFIP